MTYPIFIVPTSSLERIQAALDNSRISCTPKLWSKSEPIDIRAGFQIVASKGRFARAKIFVASLEKRKEVCSVTVTAVGFMGWFVSQALIAELDELVKQNGGVPAEEVTDPEEPL